MTDQPPDIATIMNHGPVIPVLSIRREEIAVPLAQALVAGGLHVLEITLRTACAEAAITAIQAEVPEAIVGAVRYGPRSSLSECSN